MDCLPRVWEGWSGLWAGVLSVYRCNPQPRIEIAARGFKIRAPSTIFFILFFFIYFLIIKKTFQNSSRAINRHPAGHKRPAGRYLSMTAVDHALLLDRLENWVGLSGTVLNWFRSCLQNRNYFFPFTTLYQNQPT